MSLKHSTFTVVGFDAVGGVISSTLIVCSTSSVLPEQSVTRYVLVTTTLAPSHVAVLYSTLFRSTTGAPSQLSASSVTTNTFGAGMSLKHSTFTVVGFDAVGGVISSTLIVCSTSSVLPEQSVTDRKSVVKGMTLSHVAVVTSSPIKLTTGAPSQLS